MHYLFQFSETPKEQATTTQARVHRELRTARQERNDLNCKYQRFEWPLPICKSWRTRFRQDSRKVIHPSFPPHLCLSSSLLNDYESDESWKCRLPPHRVINPPLQDPVRVESTNLSLFRVATGRRILPLSNMEYFWPISPKTRYLTATNMARKIWIGIRWWRRVSHRTPLRWIGWIYVILCAWRLVDLLLKGRG